MDKNPINPKVNQFFQLQLSLSHPSQPVSIAHLFFEARWIHERSNMATPRLTVVWLGWGLGPLHSTSGLCLRGQAVVQVHQIITISTLQIVPNNDKQLQTSNLCKPFCEFLHCYCTVPMNLLLSVCQSDFY